MVEQAARTRLVYRLADRCQERRRHARGKLGHGFGRVTRCQAEFSCVPGLTLEGLSGSQLAFQVCGPSGRQMPCSSA